MANPDDDTGLRHRREDEVVVNHQDTVCNNGLQNDKEAMKRGWIVRGVKMILGTTLFTAVRKNAPRQFALILKNLAHGLGKEALTEAAKMATIATWATSFLVFGVVYTLITVADRYYNCPEFNVEWTKFCTDVSDTWCNQNIAIHWRLIYITTNAARFFASKLGVAIGRTVSDLVCKPLTTVKTLLTMAANPVLCTIFTACVFVFSPVTNNYCAQHTFQQVLRDLVDWIKKLVERVGPQTPEYQFALLRVYKILQDAFTRYNVHSIGPGCSV